MIAALMLLVISCGEGNRRSDILGEGPPTEVTGVWTRNCVSSSSGYDRTETIFGNPTADSTTHFFSDAACTQPQYDSHFVATYQLGSPFGEGKEFNLIPSVFELTARSNEYISLFNFLKMCGYKDWKLDETRSCTSSAQANYTIYKVEGNTGYWGKLTAYKNAKSPETRPDTLDTATPFYRE